VSLFEEDVKNRQEYKISYYPNGAIFVFKYSFIMDNTYCTKNSFVYIMEQNKSVDIDTIDDFEYSEFLLKR